VSSKLYSATNSYNVAYSEFQIIQCNQQL